MKIEKGTVTILRITEVPGLDPIRVTLDDIGPSQGRINIECYGEAWASYWGGMGNQGIAEFFVGCDNSYLVGNIAAHIDRTVFSGEQFTKRCQKRIGKMRRCGELSAEKAREYFDHAEELYECESFDALSNAAARDFLHDIYGDEWWYGVGQDSEAQHPKRAYLIRIIDAVRDALVIDAESAHAAKAATPA